MIVRSAKWWDAEKDMAHAMCVDVARQVKSSQRWRRDADEYHAALYAGGPAAADIRGDSTRSVDYSPSRYPYNICRSAVDTLTAKIAKSRPLPVVLPNNGNWMDRKRSKKLTQYLEGEFWRQKFFEKWARQIVRDALVFGRGLLYITSVGKRIHTERAMPWEVYVDRWDARYGDPQNIYRIRSIDRGVALARYGYEDGKPRVNDAGTNIVEHLETCGSSGLGDDADVQSDATVDRVWIVEAWHLASGPEEGDGRYVLCVDGCTLVDEEWTREYFPFAKLDYADAIAGYWGQGLVEQAEGFQYDLNEMAEKISDAHHIMGMSLIVTDDDQIPDAHFVNGAGYRLLKRPGTSLDVFQPQPVATQTYQRFKDLPQDCLNSLGLSQMSVQSQKPAGITAGIALQTLDDVETERFAMFGRAYEAWCIACGQMYIDQTSDIAREYGEMSVDVPMRTGVLSLKWADVKITGFALRTFNSSVLPTEPAARLEKLQELYSSGIVDRVTFMRELQNTDLQSELDLQTSGQICVDEILESMLYAEEPNDPDTYRMPTEFMPLEWAMARAQQKINQATIDGAPRANVELLERFITDGQATMKQQQGLASQSAQQPGGAPGGSVDGLAPGIQPPKPMVAGPLGAVPPQLQAA